MSLKMYEIAVGLQYLHSENIIHGDLRGVLFLVLVFIMRLLTPFQGKYPP